MPLMGACCAQIIGKTYKTQGYTVKGFIKKWKKRVIVGAAGILARGTASCHI